MSGPEVDYRGDLDEGADEDSRDWWMSATDRAFNAYNQPTVSPEEQLLFVEELPSPLRYALACLLYDGEINNGGIYLVFNAVGLLVPEIIAGLRYFGFARQSEQLLDIVNGLNLDQFPRSQQELMDAFNVRYPDGASSRFQQVEAQYYALPADADLRCRIDERISEEPGLYFRNVG